MDGSHRMAEHNTMSWIIQQPTNQPTNTMTRLSLNIERVSSGLGAIQPIRHMTHVESGLSYSGLKSFMESNGWELLDEDYAYSIFMGKMAPHTNMQVLINLLTLAGYSCFNPTTFAVPNRIYVIHND